MSWYNSLSINQLKSDTRLDARLHFNRTLSGLKDNRSAGLKELSERIVFFFCACQWPALAARVSVGCEVVVLAAENSTGAR